MRAVVAATPGGPEVLQLQEVDDPVPGPSELLVRVHATALNRADLLQRRGLYAAPPGAGPVLGLECAGVVIGVGEGAAPDWLGKEVMSLLTAGGYAEQVVIHERMAMRVPAGFGWAEAAAVPEAFLTASEALFSEANVVPRERVLVHAAAGGIGSAAVQLARAAGAVVLATAGSEEKCRFVEGLGAEVCWNYKETDFAVQAEARFGPRPVDVILDFVGAAHWENNRRVLADRGRLVSIGVLSGGKVTLDLAELLRRRQRVLGLVMRSRAQQDKIGVTQRFLRQGWPLLESGVLKPVVDRVFHWERVAEAHAYMEQNQSVGKIVLSLTP